MPISAQQPKNPTILIAGGAGFIGTNLAKALLQRGIKVVAIDNLATGKKARVEDLRKDPNFIFIEADLNKEIPSEAAAATHIVHLAALETYFYRHEKANLQSLLTNALTTQNLLELARKTKAKFVLASSIEVYRGFLSSQNLENYFGTSTKEAIRFSYAEAKRFAEALVCEYYQKYGLNTVICRLGEVYGPEMDLSSSDTLGKFIEDLSAEKDLTVYGEGTEKEFYTYIDDVIEGFEKVLFTPETEGKIYPLCPLKGITVLELAYLVRSFTSPETEIRFKPKGAESTIPPEIKIIDGQIQKDLNWKVKTSLKEGIKKTIESLTAEKSKTAKKSDQSQLRAPGTLPEAFKSLRSGRSISSEVPPPTAQKPKSLKLAALSFLKGSKIRIATIIALLITLWIGFLGPCVFLALYTTSGSQKLSAAESYLKTLKLNEAKTEAAKAKERFKKAQKNLSRVVWLTSTLGFKEKTRAWDNLLSSAAYLSDTITNVSEGLEPIITTLASSTNPSTKNPPKEQESLTSFQEAQRNLLLAEAAQGNVPQTTNLSKFTKPLREMAEKIPEYKQDLELLKILSRYLPRLLGYDAPQNYLFLIQDSHELSPTGGRPISFVELTLKEGKIVNLTIDDAENLDGGGNFDLSLSQTRQKYTSHHETTKGKTVQNFAAADLFFIKDLLEITGPVFIPAYNDTIDKYSLLEKSLLQRPKSGQKAFLSNLGQKILENLTTLDRKGGAQLLALFKNSLEKKHLLINFEIGELARLFDERGWGGEILATDQDYLLVIDTNIGASKANFYVKRTINYEANLIQKEATLTINYIHGGNSNAWPGGPYENLLRVIIPRESELLSAKISQDDVESKGEEIKQEVVQEIVAGRTVLSANFKLKAQKSLSLKFKYRLPEAIVRNKDYQLAIQKQPGTDKDPLTVSLVLPSKALSANPQHNLKMLGNNLTWSWDLEKDRIFEVSY